MAVPLALGGMAAARGLAAYLAKNKAKKEMMKAGYGATRNASIPSLVSTQGGPGVFAKRLGLTGLGTGATMFGLNKMQGGDRVGEGGYMAGPMMGKSQNPSYDASMTREGQIQSLMEQMDGMGLSEEAKKRIIEDKLGPDFTAKDYHIMQEGMNYPVTDGLTSTEDYQFPSQEAYDKAVAEAQLMSKEYNIMQQGKIGNPLVGINQRRAERRNATGAGMTSNEMKAATFDRIANDPSIPMDQRITAALRRETGAAFNNEEAVMMKEKLEAMDAKRRNATGAGMTANEMKMFMGRPVQTSGYDRGPIRPRYDENGNLIPQRPTMMV